MKLSTPIHAFIILAVALLFSACGQADFGSGNEIQQPVNTASKKIDHDMDAEADFDSNGESQDEVRNDFDLNQECEEKDGIFKNDECTCKSGFAYDDYRERCLEKPTLADNQSSGNNSGGNSRLDFNDFMKVVVPLSKTLGDLAANSPGGGNNGGGGGCNN